MCTSLERLKQECREEGRKEGIRALIMTCKEFGKTYEETQKKVAEKFDLDAADAQNNMKEYWCE